MIISGLEEGEVRRLTNKTVSRGWILVTDFLDNITEQNSWATFS